MTGGDADGPRLIDVEGAESGGDLATTVVDLCGERPKILRQGSITESELTAAFEAGDGGSDAT